MASNYTDNRRKGTVVVGGRTYTRQKPLASVNKVVLGGPCVIGFGIDRSVKGRYAIVCADQLQPSHLGASQNPLHFIPEAQPRNRSTSQSGALTPERIARSLRPSEVMEGATAYTGAPVVNSRGEVIQGNGRAYMLLTYYAQFPNDPKGYKDAIDFEQSCFGLFPDPVGAAEELGIRKPVLVRMVDVSDSEAIALGQFTQADTEAIATNVTKIKAKARLLTPALQKRVIDELLRYDNSDEKTLAELIRDSKVLNVLIREEIIRPDDLENYTRNGTINEAGVEFVSSLLLNATFRGSNVNTADVFALLPVPTQNAIRKSLLYLLTATGSKSLNRELSNAIIGYREFQSTPSPNIRSWVNQYDIHGQTPTDRFSQTELAIMDLFQQSTTQKQVVTKFRQYAQLVNDQPGNMFERGTKGQTKRQALAAVFNAQFIPDRRKTAKVRAANTALTKLRNRSVSGRISKLQITSTVMNTARISPLEREYERYKAQAKNALLLFRVGDQIEAIGPDARLLSEKAGLRLHKSSRPRANDMDIMAGFPLTKLKSVLASMTGQGVVIVDSSDNTPLTAISGISPTKTITIMTQAEKEEFKKRMAKGRALAATKRKRATKTAKLATVKKSTSPKPKKSTTTSVKKRATAKKKATTARMTTAKKKASSVRVASRKEQKGKNFIAQVDKLADKIHQKSATGRMIQVPEYKVSRSEAKKRAFKALGTARKTKNVSNIRLKI